MSRPLDIHFMYTAIDDLHVVENYLSLHTRIPPSKIRDQIVERVKELADFPYTGKSASNLGFFETEFRFVMAAKYYIFYHVNEDENTVYIDRIWHSARKPATAQDLIEDA